MGAYGLNDDCGDTHSLILKNTNSIILTHLTHTTNHTTPTVTKSILYILYDTKYTQAVFIY